MANLINELYVATVKAGEHLISAVAQSNPYTNLFTNILAGGISGGAVNGAKYNELIYNQHGDLVGARGSSASAGDLDLTSAGQLVIDAYGNLINSPTIGGKVTPRKDLNLEDFWDNNYQIFGGLRAATGEIYPLNETFIGVEGDASQKFVSDVTIVMGREVKEALKFYRHIALSNPSIGNIGATSLYVAKIPKTENPLRILDYREYNLKQSFDLLGRGTAYQLLNYYPLPFFSMAKNVVRNLNKRGFDIKADPIVQLQHETARHFGKYAGILYPLLLVTRPFAGVIEAYVQDTLNQNFNMLFEAASGLFNPEAPKPKKAQARTQIQVPSNFELTEAGPINSESIFLPAYRAQWGENSRMVA